MKKWLIIPLFTCGLLSCGGSDKPKESTDTTAIKNISDNPDYKKGFDLVAGSDCFTCHNIDDALTGPAYRVVAEKYNNDDTTITRLANSIINGSSGIWGVTKMTAHPSVSLDDAKQMVKYIMLLKK